MLATHGAEAFLAEQLTGISRQSVWNGAELVIVANDPSTREQAVAAEFRERWGDRVQYLVVPRETLYASWNRAINTARADLLAIANADDLRTPTGLEAQLRCLEQDGGAVFCYGPFAIVKEFGTMTGKLVTPPDFEPTEFTRSMHAGPFFVWRKSVGGANQYFDEQFRSGGDFDLMIRLARLGRGVRVSALLGWYLDAGAGLSTGSLLQPVERTVIELRYGIFDKLDYDYLPEASRYNISHLYWGGTWHPVSELVPNYDEWMLERQAKWFRRGINRYQRLRAWRALMAWLSSLSSAMKRRLNGARAGRMR